MQDQDEHLARLYRLLDVGERNRQATEKKAVDEQRQVINELLGRLQMATDRINELSQELEVTKAATSASQRPDAVPVQPVSPL